MRIALCDDQPEERARLLRPLADFLAERGLSAVPEEYDSGEALLAAPGAAGLNLVFLDIYMGELSGLETARRLRALAPGCAVIFTTTSREHGAEAFDLEAFHYLVKPIDREKLFSVLSRWYEGLCEIRTLSVRCGRGVRELLLRDILYLEVQGRSCTIHTPAERIETATPLSAMEALLPAGEFVHPIRYCLAALRHIRSIRDDDVLLDTGETLPLSRREKDRLRQQLAAYRLRQLRRR